jgi:2',3'-cyclic-nucleotide 2'-phosphodiesterase (5'-nucleotidase family)
VKVGSADLDDAKTYTFGTSDFVIDQADKYLGFTPTGVTSTRTTIFEALIAKVMKEKQLAAPSAVRFTEDH